MRLGLFSGLVLLVALATANPPTAPVVLYDNGNTKPLAPYLSRVTAKPESPPAVSRTLSAHGLRLPIVTERLSPGRVEPRPLHSVDPRMPRSMMRPLFLFGSDAASLKWVREHRERFKSMGAVGLLVAATTDADVAAAQAAVGELPMLGAPADAIAEALNLSHYPVLITPDGISQ